MKKNKNFEGWEKIIEQNGNWTVFIKFKFSFLMKNSHVFHLHTEKDAVYFLTSLVLISE